jgi:hypothetical protein
LPKEENALAAKKASAARRSAAAAKQKGRAKVAKVMREFKQGQLKSGGRAMVKNPKQAVAIGLSEARRAGADVPPKKKSAAKKGATKRGAAKKDGAKKSAAKKTSRKRG